MIRSAFIPVALVLTLVVSCSQGPEGASTPQEATTPATPPSTGAAALEAEKSPEEIAEAFFEAGNDQDEARFSALLTEESREFLEGDSGFNLSNAHYEAVVIGDTTITGSTAGVDVKATQDGKEQDLTLKMRQEDGAWRIHAVKVTMADGVSMEVDFEKMGSMMEAVAESMGNALQEGFDQAVQDAQRGGSEQEIARKKARFEHLRAMTKEELEQQWRVGDDVGGGSALDAIGQLAAPMGLTVHEGEHSEALAKRVDTDVSGRSRLEAIETIADEVGLYPVYPTPLSMGGFAGAMVDALAEGLSTMLVSEDSAIKIEGPEESADAQQNADSAGEPPANAITFKAGPRPYPAVFTGPYLITVDEVEENVPHATGEVHVVAMAYGMDPGMLMLLQDHGETAVFDRVEDAEGNSLKADENVRYYGGGQVMGTAYMDSTGIDLKGLLRDVEKIAAISGVQRLVLPESVQTLEFDTLREGVSQRAGDWRVSVKRTGKNTEFEIRGASEQLDDLKIQFWAYDGNGEDLGIQFQNSAKWGNDKLQASLQTPEPPGRVEMKLVTAEVLEYPFELREIPLEHHEEMPAEITALSFGEHERPVEVEFVRFTDRENPDFPKVLVRAQSYANKDALTIHARFTYLDRQGKALKDFPHTLTGTFSSEGHAPVVEKGGTAEVETTAFFMPEETAGLEVSVEKVEFIDGTEWDG